MGGGGDEGQDPDRLDHLRTVNELATMDPKESDGIVTAYGYFEELDTPANKAFVKTVKDRFGPDVPYMGELTGVNYEGFLLWAKGVQKADSLDRMKVIEALETGIAIDGPTGHVTIDPKTHHTVRNAYLGVADGKSWKVIASFPDQPPADTAAVCDLVKAPATNKQFVIDAKT